MLSDLLLETGLLGGEGLLPEREDERADDGADDEGDDEHRPVGQDRGDPESTVRSRAGAAEGHREGTGDRGAADAGDEHVQRIGSCKGDGAFGDEGDAHDVVDNARLALLLGPTVLEERGGEGGDDRGNHAADHDGSHDLLADLVAAGEGCGAEDVRGLVDGAAHVDGHHAAEDEAEDDLVTGAEAVEPGGEAAVGGDDQVVEAGQGAIYLVEDREDVAALRVGQPENLAYTTQTTLSVDDTRDVIEALQAKYPAIQGPRNDDICYATQNRQDAVRELAEQADLVLVVGSPNSSNSNRLRELAEREGVEAYLIDGAHEIDPRWVEGRRHIGVTAGASAPDVLVQGVIERLRELGAGGLRELAGEPEDMVFALPKELRVQLVD